MTGPTASAEYLALVEDANLDWQVSQYVRHVRLGHHILATVIWEIAASQHGELFFQRAVANYTSPAIEISFGGRLVSQPPPDTMVTITTHHPDTEVSNAQRFRNRSQRPER